MVWTKPKLIFIGLAASLPPLALLVGLIRWFVNIPYLDQWWLLPLLVAQRKGTLTFELIWLQNAEHRLLFPKLVMLGLARWTHWDLRWEVALNFVFALTALGLIWTHYRPLRRLLNVPCPPWWLVLSSFVVFSYAPFENWLWSWQMPYFLIQCCLLFSCWMLSFRRSPFYALALGITSAVVASYSFATGFAVWAAGMAVIIVAWPRRNKLRALLIWCLALAVTISLYLSGYEFLKWNDPVGALAKVSHFLAYILVYLGAALVPTHWVTTSLAAGAIYVAVFTHVVWWLARNGLRWRLAITPFLGWAVFALSAAMLTAIGRSNVHDLIQAMTPRYITFSQLGWLGLVHALSIIKLRLPQQQGKNRILLLRSVQVIVLCGFIAAYVNGMRGMKWLSGEIAEGQRALLAKGENQQALRKIYVEPSQLMSEFRPALESYRLGPFRR